MKLSVWRQFSSNHSAAFSIVAKFESAEVAQKVAAEVTEMLLDVYRWDGYYKVSRADLTPSQIRQLFEHKVAFGTTWMLSEEHIKRALQVIGNAVLVSDEPGYSNFDGSDRAFIKLLSQFGGEVVAAVEEAGDLYLNFSADAENEDAAIKVLEHIREIKRGNEQIYFHKLQKSGMPSHGAKSVRREGKRLHFDDIYMWAHFFELSSWYAFAKNHGLSNIRADFISNRDTKRVSIEVDAANVSRMFWDAFDYDKPIGKNVKGVFAEFTSPESAEIAAKKLREILLKIQDWSQANPEESYQVWAVYWERLSPVEEELKLEYGIEWEMSAIEWIHHCKKSADFILVRHENYVLLGNLKDYFVGISPFHKILEKMEGFVSFEKGSRDLVLTMPTNEGAERICAVIKAAVDDVDYQWMPYYRGYGNFEGWKADLAKLKQHDEEALKAMELLREFVDYGDELKIQYKLTDFLQKLYTLPVFFDDEFQKINAIARDCEFNYQKLFIRDNQVHINDVRFQEAASYLGLEAFVKWLNSQGVAVAINFPNKS